MSGVDRKIEVVYLSLDPVSSGVGFSQVFLYVEALAQNGSSIKLISLENEIDETLYQRLLAVGVEWVQLPFGSKGLAGGFLRFMRLRKSVNGAEFVHARSDIAAIAALSGGAKKILWDFRGFWIDQRVAIGSTSRYSPVRLIFRLIELILYRRVDHINVLTDSARDELRRRFGHRPDHDFSAIPTCVDTERFSPPQPPTVLSAKKPRERPITFGLVGSLNNFYDIPLMLKLVAAYADHGQAKLLIATPERTRWEEKFGAFEHERYFSSPEEVPEILSKTDVGLCLCREDGGIALKGAMPTKIGEFLASGKPIVVNSGLSDACEIVRTYRCGVVVKPESKIHEVIGELNGLLAEIGTSERCRRAALERFSLQTGVRKLQSAYSSCMRDDQG